jgi:chitin disaccharide deacetylase
MKNVLLLLAALSAAASGQPQLLLRCDDIGMCHTVNVALIKVLETHLPVSTSVMFACPWYQEAVEILKNHPEVSVGIHLTLNAEWKNYRWGPVAGRSAVPTLVDSLGYFYPSRDAFFNHGPSLKEVETELRAQIDRALGTGLRIDYMDYHMGTAVDRPDFRALVERLAHEYRLAISRYFGEVDVEGLYGTSPANKPDTLVTLARSLKEGPIRLMVFHIGLQTPEMDALVDLNSFGLREMSKHREGELTALTSEKFREALRAAGARMITYRDLKERIGVDGMKRPAE